MSLFTALLAQRGHTVQSSVHDNTQTLRGIRRIKSEPFARLATDGMSFLTNVRDAYSELGHSKDFRS